MQTPIIGKRKAGEATQKGKFETPVVKRPKMAVPVSETPLRDQMRLNLLDQQQTEAWEKSSIASRYSSTMGQLARVNIKASLSALPAPSNSVDGIAEDQIARLEADI